SLRGRAWAEKKEYGRAIKDYDEAIRLDPKDAKAFNRLAWLLATCPVNKWRDGKRAVETARRACELSARKNGNYLDTLAAAYAEAGQFAEAIRWQKKALEDESFATAQGSDARKRLELYKAKKPYRQP